MQDKAAFLRLECGDSLAIMRDMIARGEAVDLVVCDPPYLIESGGNTTGEMGGCFARGKYNNSGAIVECDVDWQDFMPLIFGVLRKDAHAYIMANNRNVQGMLNAAEAAGFRFHNLLVWDKISATPNRWYMKNLEFVGFFFKGRARPINDCSMKQLVRVQQIDESDHPTEKPVALMEHYIRNSGLPGDVVFDPFMGSGSTGVAARRLGFGFYGIEKDEKHFETAQNRIQNTGNQIDLFPISMPRAGARSSIDQSRPEQKGVENA